MLHCRSDRALLVQRMNQHSLDSNATLDNWTATSIQVPNKVAANFVRPHGDRDNEDIEGPEDPQISPFWLGVPPKMRDGDSLRPSAS